MKNAVVDDGDVDGDVARVLARNRNFLRTHENRFNVLTISYAKVCVQL